MRRRAVLIALLAVLTRPEAADVHAQDGGNRAPISVLFIGNSLTSWNDLPLLVEAMSLDSPTPIQAESLTRNDFSIEDHVNAGASKRIRKSSFKYVVLQQGPSSLESSRANLREWTRKIAADIRASNAVPALYMVWPDRSRLAYLPQVAESYRLAAEDVDGVLVPAGVVWARAWQKDPKLGLYGGDQFHPSKLGTYAAAAAITTRLTGIAPETLKPRYRLRSGDEYKIDPAKAATILAAVAEVIPRATP